MRNYNYKSKDAIRRIRAIKKDRKRTQLAHYIYFLEEQIGRALCKVRNGKLDDAKRLLQEGLPEGKGLYFELSEIKIKQ